VDYFFHLIGEALKFLFNLNWTQLLRIYWHALIFDFGRYVIPDLILLPFILFSKNPQEEAFRDTLLEKRPLVSVIIPAHNEEQTILATITSVLEQSYTNLQIIIVDDGSTDNTYNICIPLVKLESRLSLYRLEERCGKASVADYAMNFCRGEYIIITDSDSSFNRDAFLEALVKFSDPKVGAVAGNLRVRNQRATLLTNLQDLEYLLSISFGRIILSWWNILFIVSGAFGVFKKETLEQFGGWDVGPGEDADLTIKSRKSGWKVAFAPRATCFTKVPDNVWGFIRQRLRWNRSLVRLSIRKHINIFNFFNSNFSWPNFIGGIDKIFFQGLLSLSFVIYLIYIFYYFYEFSLIILISAYFLYILAGFLEYLAAFLISDQKKADWVLALYVPLFPLYLGLFERFIRVVAYLDEFCFRRSYKDSFIPARVGKGTIYW